MSITKRPSEFLTTRELCALLHIHYQTAFRWREKGEGPPFVRLGQARIIYRRSDVDRWVAARTMVRNLVA